MFVSFLFYDERITLNLKEMVYIFQSINNINTPFMTLGTKLSLYYQLKFAFDD